MNTSQTPQSVNFYDTKPHEIFTLKKQIDTNATLKKMPNKQAHLGQF